MRRITVPHGVRLKWKILNMMLYAGQLMTELKLLLHIRRNKSRDL